MNDLEKIMALAAAGPAIRMLRDGGTSWQDIAWKFKKRCNPCGLTPRQLSRIYEGEEAYAFDKLKKFAQKLP